MHRRCLLTTASARLAGALLLAATAAHAARGGPDGGGWSWADSRETGVDTNVDTPLAWTTVAMPIPDEGVFPVDLSFPFTLYDVTAQRVHVSSNGWISLADPFGQAHPVNSGLPDGAAPNATIAFLWDDHGASPITWLRHGVTANGDVIEVYGWHTAGGNFYRASVEFYRSGALKIVFAFNVNVATVTIGIEDSFGVNGTQVVKDGVAAPGVSVVAPYAVLYYPAGAGPDCANPVDTLLCPAPVAGTTLGKPANASFYACGGGTYTGAEAVYHVVQKAAGPFQATLSGTGGRNQSLILLRAGCNIVWDCVASGTPAINLPSLPPGQYYVVVDGATPADDGDFTLDVLTSDADCNSNGIPDGCDISSGGSEDCNLDGRPDECPRCPVDVVFLMDTSGSMNPVAAELCSSIGATITALAAEGIDSQATVWGITDRGAGPGFSCLTDTLVNRLGPVVPGPPPPPPNLALVTQSEDWGLATAVAAGLFPWRAGALRILVPMSDEGAFQGDPVLDPGDDRDAVLQGISVAVANGVTVSPISPWFAPPGVVNLAQDLAAGTGGQWWSSGSVGGGIGAAISDIVRSACAAIGGSAQAGPDVDICVGQTVTLDGTATVMQCPGPVEYRWLDGTTEVCGTWSTLPPVCDVTPPATTVYTLEVRCQDEPACIQWDAMRVAVESAVPGDLGNTLRSYRSADRVLMSWIGIAGAATNNLYRGTQKGVWGAGPLLTGLFGTAVLTDVPAPPSLYFYRVAGVNCAGVEGP